MSYKTFNVNEIDKLTSRSGTNGYQPKYLSNDEKYFIKSQLELSGTLRDDWRVEHIATKLAYQLGIGNYVVQQLPCNINIKRNNKLIKRKGIFSKNFEKEGYQFISLETLLNLNGLTCNCKEFIKSNAIGKINFIVQNLNKLTNISKEKLLFYIYNYTTLDILVANEDRHIKNIGVFKNIKENTFNTALIFNFGNGLFESNTYYDNLNTLEEGLSRLTLEPSGENPFDLLRDLLKVKTYRNYFNYLQINQINIPKEYFNELNPIAYDYFKEIVKDFKKQWHQKII